MKKFQDTVEAAVEDRRDAVNAAIRILSASGVDSAVTTRKKFHGIRVSV